MASVTINICIEGRVHEVYLIHRDGLRAFFFQTFNHYWVVITGEYSGPDGIFAKSMMRAFLFTFSLLTILLNLFHVILLTKR